MTRDGIDFDSIDITDDLMFGTVFQDVDLCRGLIEILLDIKVDGVELVEPQEHLEAGPLSHAGIVDLLVHDSQGNAFDLEMQNRARPNLAFRGRRYLSLLDAMSLSPGQDFDEAHGAVVVFICTEDPFGRGWKRYNYPRTCVQDGRPLGDMTDIVFVNARGTMGDASQEFDALMRYLLNHNDVEGDYVRRLDERVRTWRDDPLWRRSRVFWSEKYRSDFAQARREGKAEGEAQQLSRLGQLAQRLEAAGRSAELVQAVQDPDALDRLCEEFHV